MALMEPEAPQGLEPDPSIWEARMIDIDLSTLEAETRCPVCLGVVKDCRLVSGCMHRFCADCIEKWLRVASEPSCPQCRVPMQSRRDAKRDTRFDRLLKVLYSNISRYEAQVLDPADDVMLEARATGRALMSAAAAQRAKRGVVRGPPAPCHSPSLHSAPGMGASGAASMAQQRPGDAAKAAKPKPKKARRAAPYALVQPSDTLRQVGALQHSLQGVPPVLPSFRQKIKKDEEDRELSESPSPAPFAGKRKPARSQSPMPGSVAGGSGRAKRQRTNGTPDFSMPPPVEWAPLQSETEAAEEAAMLMADAAAAAAAEAERVSPSVVVRVNMHAGHGPDAPGHQRVFMCSRQHTLGQLLLLLAAEDPAAAKAVRQDIGRAMQHADADIPLGVLAQQLRDCREDLTCSLGDGRTADELG